MGNRPNRTLDWEGAANARDLGGIPAATAPIQPGRVYRMGRSEWLTARGWQQAHHAGVRTVVDLRNAAEIGRRDTDPLVAPSAVRGIRFLNLPTQEPDDPDFTALTGPYMSSPRFYTENLRRWPEKFAAIAQAVADAPPGGVVLHCSAGRDRTGLVAALLLDLAGVPQEEIAADYRAALTGINDWHRRQQQPRERPLDDAELAVRAGAAEAELLGFLQDLDAAAYLRRAGAGAESLARLRSRLLDSPSR
ncbi:tyrosine-protein phosphatase [Arthrobacter gandavensis]|uniref:tyrosine-protein phosphatase n=1 Tax=Arthrobacter gandavensis TaxID=169960 RepID=UPI00188EB2BD|nr:tyrosine-protein phosphatase [Arthrobacter gandavensis]MBF4994046.1 tyrosine-protein phosphatase [Arthrobacter gandavensis]